MSNKLAQAFRELCGVCRVRPSDESSMEATAARLFKALGEYPEVTALAALDAWPRQSEWFPTEKELRDLCESIAAELARAAALKRDAGEGTYYEPVGQTREFVERVRGTHGEAFVRSWLAGGINCFFSASTVYASPTAADRLAERCGGIALMYGVRIEESKRAERMLAEYCDRHGLVFGQKRRARA